MITGGRGVPPALRATRNTGRFLAGAPQRMLRTARSNSASRPADKPPSSPGWPHEIKHDGFRWRAAMQIAFGCSRGTAKIWSSHPGRGLFARLEFGSIECGTPLSQCGVTGL
jgi:hypothetical protein